MTKTGVVGGRRFRGVCEAGPPVWRLPPWLLRCSFGVRDSVVMRPLSPEGLGAVGVDPWAAPGRQRCLLCGLGASSQSHRQ